MPTEAVNSKFLYTIMKQLDMRHVDWPKVAKELDISNGHAARMRYFRFRQLMESERSPTSPRTPPKVGRQRKGTHGRRAHEDLEYENASFSDDAGPGMNYTLSPQDLALSPASDTSVYTGAVASAEHCFNGHHPYGTVHHCCAHGYLPYDNQPVIPMGTFSPDMYNMHNQLHTNQYSPTLGGLQNMTIADMLGAAEEEDVKPSIESLQGWGEGR